MAEKKRAKKKRPARRELLERRFLPEQTHASRLSAGIGMAGSLALGAGVYGQWVHEPPIAHAAALVAVGALGLGAALFMSSSGQFPVRVSDIGVGIERGGEISRLRWCDLKKLRIEGGRLVLSGSAEELRIPVGAQPRATARIIAEAEKRVPAVVDVASAERRRLPAVKDSDGDLVRLEGVQLAGLKCAASGSLLSFERDARLCPNCGEVYRHDHVPKTCVTCGEDVGAAALSV
jgi:hypothetical protein